MTATPPLTPDPHGPPPGLYPDPAGSGYLRHWTGAEWANVTQEPVFRAQPPTAQATQAAYAQALHGSPALYGPAPKKKGHTLRLALIFVTLVVVVGGCTAILVAGGSNKGSAFRDTATTTSAAGVASKAEEVTIDIMTCETGEFGSLSVSGAVTNRTSKASTYFITARFMQAGYHTVQYGTGIAVVDHLQPGASATWTATTFHEGVTNVACEIADTTRIAS